MRKKKKHSELFENLGDFTFIIYPEKLYIHRIGQGHDDLMIKFKEIPELAKRLKKLYKYEKKKKESKKRGSH